MHDTLWLRDRHCTVTAFDLPVIDTDRESFQNYLLIMHYHQLSKNTSRCRSQQVATTVTRSGWDHHHEVTPDPSRCGALTAKQRTTILPFPFCGVLDEATQFADTGDRRSVWKSEATHWNAEFSFALLQDERWDSVKANECIFVGKHVCNLRKLRFKLGPL